MKIISLKTTIENSCQFVNLLSLEIILFSELEMNHVTQEPTAKNQRTCRPPKVGYRHIDCAYGYGNESEVGKALEYGLNELKIPRKVLNLIHIFTGSRF